MSVRGRQTVPLSFGVSDDRLLRSAFAGDRVEDSEAVFGIGTQTAYHDGTRRNHIHHAQTVADAARFMMDFRMPILFAELERPWEP